jgi:hypothetical protein
MLTTLADRYDAALVARQELLATLGIPGQGPPEPAPEPSVDAPHPADPVPDAPTVTTAPERPPEPAPVADPACEGVAEWATATSERLDRLDELVIEAREVGAYDYIGFIASFAGTMAGMVARQEDGPVPEAARAANEQAIELFQRLEEAADLQYEGLTGAGGGGAAATRALAEGREKADEGLEKLTELRKAIAVAEGSCGVPE